MQIYQAYKRYRKKGSSLAELGPALWIFFIFFIFPVLNMIGFMWSVSTVLLISHWSARQAGPAQNFSEAIAGINTSLARLEGFRRFARLEPVTGNGINIVVVRTKLGSIEQARYLPPPEPNKIPNGSTSLADNIYHYEITARYNVQPLFSFSSIPLLKEIPILGKEVLITYGANAAVEHPQGLND